MASALSVLYVEDDPDIQEISRTALAEIGGFTVHACPSGTESCRLLRPARSICRC